LKTGGATNRGSQHGSRTNFGRKLVWKVVKTITDFETDDITVWCGNDTVIHVEVNVVAVTQ
jgi:hypothetical protein